MAFLNFALNEVDFGICLLIWLLTAFLCLCCFVTAKYLKLCSERGRLWDLFNNLVANCIPMFMLLCNC